MPAGFTAEDEQLSYEDGDGRQLWATNGYMLHVLAAASTGSFHWVSAEVLRQAAAGQEGFLRLGLCSDSHALKLARMRW